MRRAEGFTLIELLIVITVILILASISIPVMTKIWRDAEVVKCRSNLSQLGKLILASSTVSGYYPGNPMHLDAWGPGQWDAVFDDLVARGDRDTRIGDCPSSKTGSPTDPRKSTGKFSSCSYAYMGALTPTYVCYCSSWCKTEGRDIWRLYWSGVDYGGAVSYHKAADGSNLDFHTFKSLPLADNLKWQANRSDPTENTWPTVPDHQDLAPMGPSDVRKEEYRRALKAIPRTPEDHKSQLPLLMDILVYKGTARPRPASGATEWKAKSLSITNANKATVLYANHCSTSATSKTDWGINIFYTNGSVQWKTWDQLRFQVMQKKVNVGGNLEDHCYFF